MILNNDLKSNFQLPSSRKLAESLQVSRNIVIEAYEMLTAEGYIRSVKGSGTYVNESIAIARPEIVNPKLQLPKVKDKNCSISFKSGLPALDKFPRNKWMQCYREALSYIHDTDLGYGPSNGYLPFRKTLSEYLFRSRGIRCHEDQIIVTTGASQAFYLIIQYFKQLPGTILFEEPTTKGIRDLLEGNHSQTMYHPVDHYGIDPNNLPRKIDLSCILTTPSHQYPLGGSLPISRRVELIRYARQHNCFIIEDDYDSEYRYDDLPVESLYELDPERVIYIGSFSKTLLPSIRIGYIVLPVHIVQPFYNLKNIIDLHCPTLNQATMEKFISLGYLDQHLAKTKKVYKQLRLALMSALTSFFGDRVSILGSQTGLHLAAEFRDITFTEELLDKIRKAGVHIMCISEHAVIAENHQSQLIFGYGHLTVKEIWKGIEILHNHIGK